MLQVDEDLSRIVRGPISKSKVSDALQQILSCKSSISSSKNMLLWQLLKMLLLTVEFECGRSASNFGTSLVVKKRSIKRIFMCAKLLSLCCRMLLCGIVTYTMEMNLCEARRPVLPDDRVCEWSVRTRACGAHRVSLRTWVVVVTGGGRHAAIGSFGSSYKLWDEAQYEELFDRQVFLRSLVTSE